MSYTQAQIKRMEAALVEARRKGDRLAITNLESKLAVMRRSVEVASK